MSRALLSIALASGLVAVATVPVTAANPVRVRGTIEALQGNTLTVASASGDKVAVTLKDDAKIYLMIPVNPADIKAGEFIGAGAVKSADGVLHAKQIFVFPEAQRGLGEGQRPWDVMANGVMTNATVAEVAVAPTGQAIKLTYKGGTAEIAVDPDTVILTATAADRSILKPGKMASLFATAGSDGGLAAATVRIDGDGVKPTP